MLHYRINHTSKVQSIIVKCLTYHGDSGRMVQGLFMNTISPAPHRLVYGSGSPYEDELVSISKDWIV